MFERWFKAFEDAGTDATRLVTETATGDNGTPAKDLDTMMSQVITSDNKLRIVMSA